MSETTLVRALRTDFIMFQINPQLYSYRRRICRTRWLIS